jgi:nitrite reductase (NADH) small subunit/3-phenylpropionate/trans-cinnamate dioxygenase ferredoxin subunit
MSEFHRACKASHVPEGGGLAVEVGGKVVAVFNVDGRFYAIDDMCPHMGASLAGGHVENLTVTCPWHAWRFCVNDGTWADNRRIKIGSYPVKVEGDDVFVQTDIPKPTPPKASGT